MAAIGALELEVYAADGSTVAWAVGTDPEHANPYLVRPSNYGEREVDPVAGAVSIGTIDVTVADVATTPGDQDSGFLTARLSGIRGRRCRLRLWLGAAWRVLADGPGGAPRLEGYAAYSWTIRDTRETERRLRPFSVGGTCGVAPRGPIAAWGITASGPLLPAVTPLTGTLLVSLSETYGELVGQIRVSDQWDFVTQGGPFLPASLALDEEQEETLQAAVLDGRAVFPTADVLWRLAGSSDPWNVARPSVPGTLSQRLAFVQGGVLNDGTGDEVNGFTAVLLFSAEEIPAGFPTENGTELEFIIRHRGEPSVGLPYYYEGSIADALARLYARTFELAPDLGGEVYDPAGLEDTADPLYGGGVRVDSAALASLQTPVLLRQVDPVDDGRAWAESLIYGPAGLMPTLDGEGRISPTSRSRPGAVTLPAVSAANAEPSPAWDAGDRIVNVVRMLGWRYFVPSSPLIAREPDGLAVRPVVYEYRDADAIERHGEQVIEYDGSAFAAIGTPTGAPRTAAPEIAGVLAQSARFEVLGRYANGAPAVRIRLLRSAYPTLREGDFLPVDLDWLPSVLDDARGWVEDSCQVVGLGLLDPQWLEATVEACPIAALPGFYDNGSVADDDPQPGFYDNAALESDEEGGS